MMYVGGRKSNLPAFFRVGLVITGALTIAYNGYNWYQIRRLPPDEVQEIPLVAGNFSKGGSRWR